MSTDRGEYRSIHSVLVDGPDFQSLTANARLTYLVTRLTTGPTGLALIPAYVACTAERTGLSMATVEAAVAELVEHGWVEVERNVVWCVRGLEFEPTRRPDNANHRLSVVRHVEGLPRLEVVRAFQRRYSNWFDNPIPMPSPMPLGMPSPMPSKELDDGGPESPAGPTNDTEATPPQQVGSHGGMPSPMPSPMPCPSTEDGERRTENGERKTEDGRRSRTATASAGKTQYSGAGTLTSEAILERDLAPASADAWQVVQAALRAAHSPVALAANIRACGPGGIQEAGTWADVAAAVLVVAARRDGELTQRRLFHETARQAAARKAGGEETWHAASRTAAPTAPAPAPTLAPRIVA